MSTTTKRHAEARGLVSGMRLELINRDSFNDVIDEGGRAMYEPLYEEESGGGGFVMGLLCGVALGAAIGMMFAPKAGSELRQKVYESTGDLRRKA